jgi:hypothetical protein
VVVVELSTGRLELTVQRADLPLEALCGFAARRNPRRGFLFVSRVLGRHLSARPSVLGDVHRRLALKVAAALPGPVVFLGLAETAVALGRGVFEHYVQATGRSDVLFVQSTRYPLRRPIAFRFNEDHSHASAHVVYLPEAPRAQALMRQAKSLVVVDDEASTGQTFVNIVTAFRQAFAAVEEVTFATITDWRPAAVPLPEGLREHPVSLLAGQYTFTPSARPAAAMPRAEGSPEPKDELLSRNDGRFGVLAGASAPVLPDVAVAPASRVLVLGTGEFVYPPYLLAARLERLAPEVFVQATTRSPVMVGHAIDCSLEFGDHCRDGIANYLYNVRRGDYDRVLVCYETPASCTQHDLLDSLGAEAVYFQ